MQDLTNELAREQAKEKYLDEHLITIGWPMTLPDDLQDGCEILRVVIDTTGKEKMHVNAATCGYCTEADAWGAILAEVARTIVEQHPTVAATGYDGDHLAAMRYGFNEELKPNFDRLLAHSIDDLAAALFTDLCNQYPFWSCEAQVKSRAVLEALIALFDDDPGRNMRALYKAVLEDARVGRSDADIEDYLRDARQRRAAST